MTSHSGDDSNSNSIFTEPSLTRLVTIIAQVDHGKTTLADSLIESNNIISERLAGTVRYLDDLEEEQRRGITMRTSAIGLSHWYQPSPKKHKKLETIDPTTGTRSDSNKTTSKKQQQLQKFIIHLLDSPGHADFSSEVSSALTCCDAALLVVDAVEGMCARTHQVLREAFVHQLVPILIINKIDRLCTELCLTEEEAYLRIRKLLESINAASAAMINSSRAETNDTKEVAVAMATTTTTNAVNQQNYNTSDESILWTFTEANVVFGSALHGWGFTISSLARHLFRTKQLEIKPMVLRQYLLGDYKFQSGRVLKWKPKQHNQQSNPKDQCQPQQQQSIPMFSQFALQPIWKIYHGVSQASVICGLGSNSFGNTAIASSSSTTTTTTVTDSVKISATTGGMEIVQEILSLGSSEDKNLAEILHQTGSFTEDSILRAVLRRYRPLSEAVLNTICDIGPSPQEAAETVRTRALVLQSGAAPEVISAVTHCNTTHEGPVVAHVCKFLSTTKANILSFTTTMTRGSSNHDDIMSDDTLLMGIARVFSGVLKTNSTLYCMGPKYNPRSGVQPEQRKIRLYLLMGSSLVPVNQVPAGHLCAIHGLEDLQLKTVTLSSSLQATPLLGIHRKIRPLVKVNVEPEDANDAQALERGLYKLALADAAVEVTATAKGERILACLGEIHLEQSLLDLKKLLSSTGVGKEIQFRKSEPIVEFGETTEWFDDDELDYCGKQFGNMYLSGGPSTSSTHAIALDSSKATSTSIIPPPLRHTTIPPYNEEEGIALARRGRMRALLSGKNAALWIRVVPLAEQVYQSMQSKKVLSDSEIEIVKLGNALGGDHNNDANVILERLVDSLYSMDANGNALIESQAVKSGVCVKGIVGDEVNSNGHGKQDNPSHDCDNDDMSSTVENTVGWNEYEQLLRRLRQCGGALSLSTSIPEEVKNNPLDQAALNVWRTQMSGSLVAGFQLGLRAGPFCEEPVHRVLVVLEGIEVAFPPTGSTVSGKVLAKSTISGGMVISAMKQGIRCALLSRPARLMEGHLKLTLHTSFTGLGNVYAVLSKRRGKVLEDSMVDGTDLLLITATVPQAESFGLSQELLRKTSGEVTVPELSFLCWNRLDEDPFWIPTSLEEREDYGEIVDSGDSSTGMDNTALNYIRLVRERKGLLVDSAKTVMAAEKQRTMKR